ncbi:MAG: FAD-dependent oxidoreductase, partial [Acidobacteria bacterium]|nr:FAD-dependent oxidoreductase [Acidobacteriota bacterium]
PSLEIVVLEKGSTISYGACGLPYYIEGQVRDLGELIHFTPGAFRSQRNIDVRTGAQAIAIRHARREVALAGGESLHYDKLVIATGARAGHSAIAGSGLPHVFTLQTIDDARRLSEFLRAHRPRRAAVIGAGYIGLEIATALRAQGLAVTVLESGAGVLGREEAELTARVAQLLEQFGVELRLGTRIDVIQPDRAGEVPCDLVVLAAGLRPNTELAADAGVEIGRTGAIRTNDRMETNLHGVWAAGDCAEATHLVTGRPVWLPLGTTANTMGRVAGANLAGARERFPGVAGTSIVRICGVAFAFTGLSAPEARREGFDAVSARIEDLDRPAYFRGRKTSVELVADRRTRRLLGGSVIGQDGAQGRINVIAAAVTQKMRVGEFAQLDLAYSPPYSQVWDPLLIAAQQAEKLLD